MTNKRILYTDNPNTSTSTFDKIGMIFAVIMLCIVLPVALYIISTVA